MNQCACGCGKTAKPGNRWVHGHNAPGTGVLRGGRKPFPAPNPSGICHCGCGQTTPKAPRAILSRQIEKGQHYRYCRGHAYGYKGGYSTRPREPRHLKGLSYNSALGRWVIHCRDGSRMYYYRAVMEAHLKRPLLPTEVVHHINGDSTDDRIENLELVGDDRTHHVKHHAKDSRERIALLHVAQTRPAEYYLDALREWIAEHGHIPRGREIDADPAMPDSSTYRNRFGSWRRAVEMAQPDQSAR